MSKPSGPKKSGWHSPHGSPPIRWRASWRRNLAVAARRGGIGRERAITGKRGGVRVIDFNRLECGDIWLLVIYAKAVRGNIPAHVLKAIKEAIEHD